MEVVGRKRRGRDVPRIVRHGANAIEVEGLSVEDVICQTLFQKFDKILSRAPSDETGFDTSFLHHVFQITDKGERDASGTRLEGEAVAHDARVTQELSYEVGDAEPIG